jgi:hypothetical protein
MSQVLADVFQIEVIEASVSSRMEKNHDNHDFSIAHAIGLVTVLYILIRILQHVIFLMSCKFFAKIICQTINFSNFSLGEHSDNRFKVIIEHYKFNTFIAILLIFNQLFIQDYIELTLILKHTCGTPANCISAVSAASELQAIAEVLTEFFG